MCIRDRNRIVAVFLFAFACVSAQNAGSCQESISNFISSATSVFYLRNEAEKSIKPFRYSYLASKNLKVMFNACQDILKSAMSTKISSNEALQCFNNVKAATLNFDSLIAKVSDLANGKATSQEFTVAQETQKKIVEALIISCGEASLFYASQSEDKNCQGLINGTRQIVSQDRQLNSLQDFVNTCIQTVDYCLQSIPKQK
eukprot:TRINITY_DN4072_c0_g2_i8.p1 TRINITY_DN4072_c0_g2~~TRINITY_DN4072_c0_g2_i8.p1  ORF type:complete len:217 (+),score=27.81 TRINITY_DN4072_c0_g2_i8:49-651(+)